MAYSPNQQKFSEGKQLVTELISIGLLDIDAHNTQGHNPLHAAVFNEKYLLVESLLHNGIDVNTRTKQGYTSLALAIEKSLPDMVKLLLDHKADLFRICKNGESALRLAIRKKILNDQAQRLVILDLIFKYGLKSKDNLQVEYFKLCKAIVNNDYRASKRLVDRLEDVNFKSIDAERPLTIAAYLNHLNIAELLLQKGVSKHTKQLALGLAVDKKSLEMVKLLLKFKTNVNFFSLFPYKSLKQTPLHQAIRKGDIEMMKLLLNHGALVGALRGYIGPDGSVLDTVLHLACERGFSEGVKLLLEKGAKVNAKNSRGATPIFSACHNSAIDNTECVKILLEHRADISVLDNSKHTILHYIRHNEKSNFVEFVIDEAMGRGVNINARSKDGDTAIHDMSCKNLVLFLKRGADLNIQSNDGSYPTHYGTEYEQGEECPTENYLQRLQFLGYQIKNSDFQNIVVPDDLSAFYQDELNQLKNWIIAWNPKITLYNVLFMKRNELRRFSANKNLLKAFAECNSDFESKYPYFGSILNVQLRRGFNRQIATTYANDNLRRVFGQKVPDICSNMIFKFLTNCQVQQFAEATFKEAKVL